MEETKSREKILKDIREALVVSAENTFSDSINTSGFFKESEEISEICFAEAFKNIGGNFVYCANESEFGQNIDSILKAYAFSGVFCNEDDLVDILERHNIPCFSDDKKLETANCALTGCEYLISQTGSIMVSAQTKKSYRIYFTTPVHFVLAYTSQIVKDISQALQCVKSKYDKVPDFITFISGPSRTADIEKTLVMGAHGPGEIFVFLLDDIN